MSYDRYMDFVDQEVVMAVGQRAFSAGTETFCILLPLLVEDGTPVDIRDFPARGTVWWRLRPGTRQLAAEPGRLVCGRLERSREAGTPGKDDYQAVADGIEALRPKDYVELLEVPPDAAQRQRELVTGATVVEIDHPPTDTVYLLWRGQVCGPFRTTSHEKPGSPGTHAVSFATHNVDKTVISFPDSALRDLPKSADHRLTVEVSLSTKHVSEIWPRHSCTYRLISAGEFGRIIPKDARQVTLLSDRDVLAKISKELLTRKRRQQFLAIVDELATAMGEVIPEDGALPGNARDVLDAVRRGVEAGEAVVAQLASALVDSGLLGEQIEQAKQAAIERYINENSARAQAQIDEKIDNRKGDRESLEKEIRALEEKLRSERKERFQQLDKEIDLERKKLVAEEARIADQRKELERQSQVLERSLKQVAAELAKNSDAVINRFLTIQPLLSQLSLLPGGRVVDGGKTASAGEESSGARQLTDDQKFDLPPFVTRERTSAEREISEVDFMARFQSHVEKSGFRHRWLDLVRFHLSVKCGEITILGGYPGTGKSTLPQLYAEAMLGEAMQSEEGRFLRVVVSPSWLDMRDLLGHVNALDHVFQPGEAGLYQHVIAAQEEFRAHGLAAGLYLVCLDEMNLAHVEHYFSGFLQALELPSGHRVVRCFSPEVVDRDSAFAAWPALNIPTSVRFVGTVNLDETTKQLSQRLLDRANVIRLVPEIPLGSTEAVERVLPDGEPVRLRDYASWSVAGSERIETELAGLIDRLRRPLAVLGSVLNPRKYNAIRRFMASCPPELLKPVQTLDVQIAQRLLPQARNLFRPGAREALREVQGLLGERSADFPESLSLLNEMIDNEALGVGEV